MTNLQTDRELPAAHPLRPDARFTPLVADDGRSALVVQVESGVVTAAGLWSADGDAVGVLAALREWVRAAGHRALTVEVLAEQHELTTALQAATVLSTYMVKPLPDVAPTVPSGFAVRPMTDAEYRGWLGTAMEEYARDDLARAGGDLDLARRRARESFDRHLPDGPATADTRLLTATQGDEPVGVLWVRHHRERYPTGGNDETFTLDVAVDATHRGRGLGRAAMLAVERLAVEAGDTRLGLNVFGPNRIAGNLYRSLGYVPCATVFEVALA